MKGKILTTAVLASLLVASNAFASLARMAVMGTQPVFTSQTATGAANGAATNLATGSLWYDEEYNVFYNPAQIMNNKNYAVVQKGLEGGWFDGIGDNFAYGIYVNRGGAGNVPNAAGAATSTAATGIVAPGMSNRTAIGGASTFQTQRPIDFFVGGDMGIKWGFHAAWAYNRNQDTNVISSTNSEAKNNELSARYWHFDLGAEIMGFEPFIGLTTMTKFQNDNPIATPTAAGASNANLNEFNVGVRYKYENWTPFVAWKKYRENGSTLSGGTTMRQTRMNILGLGFGHVTKIADGVNLLKGMGFYMNSVEDSFAADERNKSYKQYILPINMTIEADATSWLVLRAGASYDFWNEVKYDRKFAVATGATDNSPTERKISQAGTTTFRLGSTFKFGKLHVDSAFGVGAAGGGNTADLDEANFGFDSQTFAIVSASYRW